MVDVALMATMAVLCTILHIASTTSGRLQSKLFLRFSACTCKQFTQEWHCLPMGLERADRHIFYSLVGTYRKTDVLSGMNPMTGKPHYIYSCMSLHSVLSIVVRFGTTTYTVCMH